jgi:hypothetical protein
MQRRVWLWTGIGAGLVFAGLGVLFLILGLDNADKSASVVGAFVGVAGLALTTVTTIITIRSAHKPGSSPESQTVEDVTATDVNLVDGAANVRIGSPKAPDLARPRPPAGSRPQTGQQRVNGVHARGDVRIIRNVDGDIDLA